MNRKKHLALMTDTPACILSQYLWYNRSIQMDKASEVSVMFRNFLVTMVPLKKGLNLRENTIQPT